MKKILDKYMLNTLSLSRSWKHLMREPDGTLKPAAVRVLADLRRFCQDSAVAQGHWAPSDNESALAFARRREVEQRILNFIRLNEDEDLTIDNEGEENG